RQTTASLADKDHDGAIGFLNRNRMPETIVVRNARRRRYLIGMRAGAERGCEAEKRPRDAEDAPIFDGYPGCHGLRPCPVSVRDKAVSAAIVLGRLVAAGNAIDAVDAAKQIGLRIGRRGE